MATLVNDIKLAQKPSIQKEGITGSEAVLLSLLEEGVDTIFGYPGGAIMPVYDAMYDYQDRLNHILVRHEQGAAHAAQGYARVTDRVGVCMATSGPGATNLITGIADAMIDSTAMVCITGQVGKHLLGTDAFQETDVVGISMPVTKWNYQVTSADEIPEVMAKAFYIARTGRPGPVLIDITKNAQFEKLDFEYKKCERVSSYHPKPKVKEEKLKQAAEILNHAQRPYLLIGHGILLSSAQAELKTFVEKAGIPFASTLLGLSAMPNDHPNYVGYLGMHGNYGPNIKTNECDVLVAIGMRFDDRVTGDLKRYAKQAKVIHVEIDPAEIDKNVKTDVAILGDAKDALKGLIPLIKEKTYPEWMDEFEACKNVEQRKVIDLDFSANTDKLKMAEVINALSKKTEGKAITVTDVGQHQMVTSRYYEYMETNSNVTSGGLGTMGFALPAAMGAKLAQPNREVIVVVGDGGFQMTLQEMATIAQYNIPVKVLLLNNSFLGMVRQWQHMFFDDRYSFTEMTNPNFIKLSEGFGVPASKVSEREELSGQMDKMLSAKGPYLLEVVVEKETDVFPMIPTGESVSNIRLD